jgi:CelD/BcsL family acetyltransferase involved in cellulose biosynthesis
VTTRIVEVDPTTDPRWDAFVHSRPDASVFHHSAWLRALEAEYGQRPQGLAAESGAHDLHGVLPLVLTRGLPFQRSGRLTGRRLSSLPRTPTAGPLAIDAAALQALTSAGVERAKKHPAMLQMKVEGPRLDGVVEGLAGVPWRPTYVIDLPRHPAEVRFGNGRNHARIKWAVSKAERMNVRVRRAESETELRAWYELYLATMRSYVLPPRPYRFFVGMWSYLRPLGFMELTLAERVTADSRTLLAGSIFLKFRDTVFYAFNGRRRSELSLRPNDLIMWHAIHEAAGAGYRRFDLGEVDPKNETLAEFKMKWGSVATWLYRYYHPNPGVPADPIPDGQTLKAARALWRRMPLAGTAIVGDQIYRFL